MLALSSGYIRHACMHPGPLQQYSTLLVSFVDEGATQWLLTVCFGVYFLGFAFCRRLLENRILLVGGTTRRQPSPAQRWLLEFSVLVVVVWALAAYAVSYQVSYKGGDVLTFVVAATAGQIVGFMGLKREEKRCSTPLQEDVVP